AAGFDLSIGSVLVFAQVCAAKVMGAIGGDGIGTMLVGMVVAVLGGVVWGLFNGWCIAKLKVPALITTLGSLGAALGVAY
ncbi:ABC transporter permease, partial [Rhizobium johnstonii]